MRQARAGIDGFTDQVETVEEERPFEFATGCRPILRHDRVLAARNPLHGRSIAL